MTLEELRDAVAEGEVDTVLLAMTDMQGRLQGKRLTAQPLPRRRSLEHGAEACNYLLAVDVEMNTVDGYAMSSWERGYGDFEMGPDLATLRARAVARRAPRCAWPTCAGRDGTAVVAVAAPDPARASSTGSPSAGWSALAAHRARVHRLPRHLRAGVRARATATSSRPTTTTSTTRCSAPRGWSR